MIFSLIGFALSYGPDFFARRFFQSSKNYFLRIYEREKSGGVYKQVGGGVVYSGPVGLEMERFLICISKIKLL